MRPCRPPLFALTLVCLLAPGAARAYGGRDTGLGVAVGGAFSATKLQQGSLQRTAGNSVSWGFFVDIPLLDTFYISPAAMLYELDLGEGLRPVTDIDLSFKFIVPLGLIRPGVGLIFGLTTTQQYLMHVGALAHLGLQVSTNFDAFVQFQYKRVMRSSKDLDDLHGYVGGMFRF